MKCAHKEGNFDPFWMNPEDITLAVSLFHWYRVPVKDANAQGESTTVLLCLRPLAVLRMVDFILSMLDYKKKI